MRYRQLARVQRLPPESQLRALARGDQIVERPGRRRRAAALRQAEEDLLGRTVQLVAHQREPGCLQMCADLVLPAGARHAAEERHSRMAPHDLAGSEGW